jgi:hypothetical protein
LGKPHGIQKIFDESGNLISERLFKEGKPVDPPTKKKLEKTDN